jgi:bifunctional NMN adenylyltransferase/nudix hydrolase
MRTKEQARTAVAGIVGRWQVPDLTEGHRAIIDEIMKHHRKVIIFVGTHCFLGSTEDTLDYPSRQQMIQEHYPSAMVLPIATQYSDEVWSNNLDDLIRQVAPIGEVTLYGGRDSFIDKYTGKFRTIELDALSRPNGTEVRREAGRTVLPDARWRAGQIYLAQNQYPRTHLTVDIAAIREVDGVPHVLLGKKANRPGWRFPGGFFDPTVDSSLEAAARRELYEEADINIQEMDYAGSFLIPDWRLRGTDVILTAFFVGHYTHGPTGEAGDDLDGGIGWFAINELRNIEAQWSEDHKELFEALLAQVAFTTLVN